MAPPRTTVTVDYAEIRTAVREVDEEAQSLEVPGTDGPPGLLGLPPREDDE